MHLEDIARANEEKLRANSYPGRGIIIGQSPDEKHYIQVYWIMGRSENSKNRVFDMLENGFVRTKVFDERKVTDPSLIIYFPVKHVNGVHIVSNGDQTDTIEEFIKCGKSFMEALETRTFEPDSPNFTPRISGIIETEKRRYALSILKSLNNNPDYCQRYFYFYDRFVPGFGHFICTYNGDGNPLPSFTGEPEVVRMFNNIDEVAEYYWDTINMDNKVSLLVKFINAEDNSFKIRIMNKNR